MIKKLLLLLISSASLSLQAQFFENFEGGVFPPGWIVASNGVGTIEWTLQTVNSNTNAYINRENIGDGNTEEDWLVTPGINVSGDNFLSFWCWQNLSGDQGTLYQIRISTISQTDQSTFVTIEGWNEPDLIGGIFNLADQKVISLDAYENQTVYIAFVRVHTQNGAALNGDRWYIDDVSVSGQVQPFNNISGHVFYSENADCSDPQPISYNPVLFSGVNTTSTYTLPNGSYSMNCNNLNVPISVSAAIPAEGFLMEPPAYNYNFDSLGHVETANFCLKPDGSHPDLSVDLMHYFPGLVPGVTTTYSLTVANIGNQMHSGTVNLNYDSSKIQLIGSSETPANQATDVLSWNFENLVPFHEKSIEIQLRLNSPTDSPAVNLEDMFTFTASIDMTEADDDLSNNTQTREWIAKMPYDPNSKEVMEGESIDVSRVDDYLHYVVNFQNLGTAPAGNVKITDLIDTDLDVSSLRMLHGSHPFTTLVENRNLIIRFDGINLPPAVDDEPQSHGYVAFKIKPANAVSIGSVMSNKANIYFDFNYPITTNTVTTTVTALGVDDFDLSRHIRLFPNPAATQFTLHVEDRISVTGIFIFNTLGQLVKKLPAHFENNAMTADVADLNPGTYFLKISTEDGSISKKFIKL